MDGKRRRQVEELCRAALDQAADQRSRFLADACGGDEELHQLVADLLAQRESAPTTPPTDSPEARTDTQVLGVGPGTKLGPYEIVGLIGAGGMGSVYRALDTRLGRAVAIKTSAERFSARFEREARAISALNHPNVCTLYDVGSVPSGPSYMVTELVEGDTLRDWLRRSPSVEQSLQVARQVLEALRAAHEARIVHRDLKPGNIMVRPDGRVKVLDFGLAKWMPAAGEGLTQDEVTVVGQIVGTVAYMAPEQVSGEDVDARCDLFALGVILHEMLTGRHPWPRKTAVDVMHAIVNDDPPAVEGPWAPVVRRLLAKNRVDRYASAQDVLDALAEPAASSSAPSVTRLIVLPFRILRHHDDSDFLAASLPDAISSSLAGIESLVVRSTMMASRLAAAELDLKTIAEQAQVDAILTGTLLSDGTQLRINTQLMRASDGALLWSNHSRASLQDLYQLQDELVDKVVQTLAQPLTPGEKRRLKRDAPASALAYELHLRGNQMAASAGFRDQEASDVVLARDLYRRSTQEDPNFAPAWAGLGRVYRIIGKYAFGDRDENYRLADQAFERAFAENPESALAHNYYTYLQTDLGRSLEAMDRLLRRARTHRNDLDLLAGLVHACRYCGLPEASVAADTAARRLDPNVITSVSNSYEILQDYHSALAFANIPWSRGGALAGLGRTDDAVACYAEWEKATAVEQLKHLAAFARYRLQGDRQKSLEELEQTLRLPGPMVSDSESDSVNGRLFALLGQFDRALEFVARSFDSGFNCYPGLSRDAAFDPVRSDPRFKALLTRGEKMTAEAQKLFRECGGEDLLGVRLQPVPGVA